MAPAKGESGVTCASANRRREAVAVSKAIAERAMASIYFCQHLPETASYRQSLFDLAYCSLRAGCGKIPRMGRLDSVDVARAD